MKPKIILHLCADTGSDSYPYSQDSEYKVIRIGSEIGVENFDEAAIKACGEIYGIFANPPCLEFSIARTGGVARNPEEGMKLVRECQRIISYCEKQGGLKFWVIENPATGALRNYLGKPNYSYQPWWYGSPWTKKTALWGRFNIPERKFINWEDVPKNENLWVRKRNRIAENDRYTGKPEMHTLHKSAYKFIDEFHCLPKQENDMEFRSICSQKFAEAFYKVNH
ncbi:MAG TPA: hypothetical protein VIY47_04310 [Ignavibacteriaceae bacterium]